MKTKTTAKVLGAALLTMTLARTATVYAEEEYTIGIEQFAEHGSLDNCREGFLEGLKEEGIEEGKNLTVEYKNAAADMGTCGQISDGFAADKVDLMVGIATPSAQSLYNAAMDAGIPVIYTAVTDPLAAELADDEGNPVGEITGTSDKLPVKQQLEMIRQMLPEAETIGIMYTTSEANSEAAVKEYEELAGEYDFKIETAGIATTADIPLAAQSLLEKVDCMTILLFHPFPQSLKWQMRKKSRYSEARSNR